MELEIDEIVGSFRITGKIGSGGMGAVYRAEHVLIGNVVAIKVLRSAVCANQEIVGRFFNEAKAASTIQHPGIVSIHDFGYYRNRSAYIVMEYLEGEPLGERIERQGKLPIDMAMSIASQITSALGAAHAKNIIHRDLKPDNVMLVHDPDIAGGERIKLLDFGVAKLMTGGQNYTQTGFVLGTPTYMAPEQCRGPTYVDGRSDLYSLGCMLYKMVCGCAPFPSGSPGEVLSAHLYTQPPPPRSIEPGIPTPVEALILRLLEKEPEARYRSASDLLFAMRSLLPEGNAHKNAPRVSSIAKTLPFAKASRRMSQQRLPPGVEVDDEATVVDSAPSEPKSAAPAGPDVQPNDHAPGNHRPSHPPGRELSTPARPSTISHATASVPVAGDAPNTRSVMRYLVPTSIVLTLVVMSLAATLLESYGVTSGEAKEASEAAGHLGEQVAKTPAPSPQNQAGAKQASDAQAPADGKESVNVVSPVDAAPAGDSDFRDGGVAAGDLIDKGGDEPKVLGKDTEAPASMTRAAPEDTRKRPRRMPSKTKQTAPKTKRPTRKQTRKSGKKSGNPYEL